MRLINRAHNGMTPFHCVPVGLGDEIYAFKGYLGRSDK